MSLLLSNYPPVKMDNNFRTFADTFFDLLTESNHLDIAVGFVTAESLAELHKIAEYNTAKTINLIIGMHFIDKFTPREYKAAINLNSYLREHEQGEVRLVTPFRYHGKIYSYSRDDKPFASIIGSNNLSSIVEGGIRTYESSLLVKDVKEIQDIYNFYRRLKDSATKNIDDLNIDEFKMDTESAMEGQDSVEKVPNELLAQILASRTEVSFEIPLKPYEDSEKSNLNVFFGKGRQGHNGLVKPRHWYEIEIIVPKNITCQPGYPEEKKTSGAFDVVTDDGWKFKCYVGGDYKKNFRSEDDLKILGRWIKGRLESKAILQTGEPLTRAMLSEYGRSSFTLTKTKIENLWYLDFGVK